MLKNTAENADCHENKEDYNGCLVYRVWIDPISWSK